MWRLVVQTGMWGYKYRRDLGLWTSEYYFQSFQNIFFLTLLLLPTIFMAFSLEFTK